jgi:hypothetical protein
METVVGFRSQVRRLSSSVPSAYTGRASGENVFLLPIYSLAMGCHSKIINTGESELAQGSLLFNKYYRLTNAMFSGEDTSTDRIARS